MAESRRLAARCLGRATERLVQVCARQSGSVVVSEPTTDEREVKLVLSLLEQLLPHVHRNNDALRAPVRAEVHGFAITGIEPLGDLVQCVTGLARRDNLGHA